MGGGGGGEERQGESERGRGKERGKENSWGGVGRGITQDRVKGKKQQQKTGTCTKIQMPFTTSSITNSNDLKTFFQKQAE